MKLEESGYFLCPFPLAVECCRSHVEKEKLQRHRVVNDASWSQNVQHFLGPSIYPKQHRGETSQCFSDEHQSHESIFCLLGIGLENQICKKQQEDSRQDTEDGQHVPISDERPKRPCVIIERRPYISHGGFSICKYIMLTSITITPSLYLQMNQTLLMLCCARTSLLTR